MTVIGLTLSPASAFAGCDLAKVAGALGSGLPHGPKRPELPVVKAHPMDFKGAYSIQYSKFMRDEIVFSQRLQLKTGIRKVARKRRLGSGGSGVVYEAEVEYSGGAKRRMAWKEISGSLSGFEREGLPLHYKAAGEIDGVVPVELEIDVKEQWEADPSVVVVLSELRGPSLFSCMWPDKLGLTALSAQQRLRLAEIVAEQGSRILAGLRAQEIVHADVKPANIVIAGGEKSDVQELLEGRAHLELLDFGLALKQDKTRSEAAGSLSYMSPWVFYDPTHRPTNDLYALGIILAEILTGRMAKESILVESMPPWPGFESEDVQANIDRGIRTSVNEADTKRVDHLKQYVLRLLDSTMLKGPTEAFTP